MSNSYPQFSYLLGPNGGSIGYNGSGKTLTSSLRILTNDNVNVNIMQFSIPTYNDKALINSRMRYVSSRFLEVSDDITNLISSYLTKDDGTNQLNVRDKYNNIVKNAGTIFNTPVLFYQYIIGVSINGFYYLPLKTYSYRLIDISLILNTLCNPKNANDTIYTKLTNCAEYFTDTIDTISTTSVPVYSGFYYEGNSIFTSTNCFNTVARISVLNDIGNSSGIVTHVCTLSENISSRKNIIFSGYTCYLRSAYWETLNGSYLQNQTQLFSKLIQTALKNVGSADYAHNIITAWNISDKPVDTANPSASVANGDILLIIDTNMFYQILTDLEPGELKSLNLILDLYPVGVTPVNIGLTNLYPYYNF